jgi:hypothetical protein
VDAVKARKLIEVLTRQQACQHELKAVLTEQQQALRRFDAAALDALHLRGDRLAQRISELESARLALTGPSIHLKDLAASLAEPQRGQLLMLGLQLATLARETSALGRVNRAAVQCMLNHFHSVYRLMAQASSPSSYGPAAARPSGGGAFLLDAVA